jgi:hypothetical protein
MIDAQQPACLKQETIFRIQRDCPAAAAVDAYAYPMKNATRELQTAAGQGNFRRLRVLVIRPAQNGGTIGNALRGEIAATAKFGWLPA